MDNKQKIYKDESSRLRFQRSRMISGIILFIIAFSPLIKTILPQVGPVSNYAGVGYMLWLTIPLSLLLKVIIDKNIDKHEKEFLISDTKPELTKKKSNVGLFVMILILAWLTYTLVHTLIR